MTSFMWVVMGFAVGALVSLRFVDQQLEDDIDQEVDDLKDLMMAYSDGGPEVLVAAVAAKHESVP